MGRVLMSPGGAGSDLDAVTATAGDVLAGKTIVDKEGEPVAGTMVNNGAKTAALNCGGSYVIPAGYHNGSGKVTANSLASQTGGATAAEANVETGKTFWKDGVKKTGTMATMAGGTKTPTTAQQTIACNGKKMTSNIIIAPIPSNYVDTSAWTVFNNGTFANGFGWVPKYKAQGESGGSMETQLLTRDVMYIGNLPKIGVEGGAVNSALYLNRCIDLTKFNKIIATFRNTYYSSTAKLRPWLALGSPDRKCVGYVTPVDNTTSTNKNDITVRTYNISTLSGQYFLGLYDQWGSTPDVTYALLVSFELTA